MTYHHRTRIATNRRNVQNKKNEILNNFEGKNETIEINELNEQLTNTIQQSQRKRLEGTV